MPNPGRLDGRRVLDWLDEDEAQNNEAYHGEADGGAGFPVVVEGESEEHLASDVLL